MCDTADNDCNGTVDDVDPSNLTGPAACGACGVDCFAQLVNVPFDAVTCTVTIPGMPGTCGSTQCAANYHDRDGDGSCETFCVTVAADDSRCDGVDDDCDGFVDEDVDLCTSAQDCGACGRRCVAVHGESRCVKTGTDPACSADNTACELVQCECTGPGSCWHDADRNPSTGCEYLCDVTNGGVEVCDGLDNDCDGLVDAEDDLSADPGISAACTGDPDGLCAEAAHAGLTECISGVVVCRGANVLREGDVAESCNNVDDDCDGVTDNRPVDEGRECGASNVAPCVYGRTVCLAGGRLVCSGAVEPRAEVCNGLDDDCDGQIDLAGNQPPSDSVGACNVPTAPPAGATSACRAGTRACQGGTVVCTGSALPQASIDTCGVDANCDGQLTNQPNTQNDIHHCGYCGNDCLVGAVHASWTCVNGGCQFMGCNAGYYDNGGPGDPVAGDNRCGYACTFASAEELCNGVDDNCDGQVDENVTPPPAWQVCGTSPAATASECTTGVTVSCRNGGWACQFPGGVCSPTCGSATENCTDGLDNDCNSQTDECGSTPAEICDGCDNDGNGLADDGVTLAIPCGFTGPGEPAACAGVITCKPPTTVPPGTCSPVGGFAACTLAGTPNPEVCNALDDDCDGIVDDVAPEDCVPSNAPPGLTFGANSGCKRGRTTCVNGVTQCLGFVGPSPEVCDGVDNDCDGQVDDLPLGSVGMPCGVNQPPCSPGATACVNGAMVCQGGVQPQPETCDGIDNNCNGIADEGPLADAPPPGMNGCWTLPGNCCQFDTLTWCPPPGASCSGLGSLQAPCSRGTLECSTGAWQCTGERRPTGERCDGLDNDCDGQPDDAFPEIGQACGPLQPDCVQGLVQCSNGRLECAGATPQVPEFCDGRDNDCDGIPDDNIASGGLCVVAYDTTAYPGPRDRGSCVPGGALCGSDGTPSCVGGRGPQPEVCDGVDNDCDGEVDEAGAAPDGVDGSADVGGNPSAVIGETCGLAAPPCGQGTYACEQGWVVCSGAQVPRPETCNGVDDDCDGLTDNLATGAPPLCGEGAQCVRAAASTTCGQPCAAGPYPCPTGQACVEVVSPVDGTTLAPHCMPAP